jgi:tetratricopeptide (TPR) repeat protein
MRLFNPGQVILLFAILVLFACSSNTNNAKNHLGEISFDASGKAEAQPNFKKGLLLLHSFEYDDAAEEFQQAIKTDSGFVMAYWGEAMTHNHPLWREQNLDKGKAILQRLAPTPEERIAKAKTELEKDLVRAVDILYGKGNKTERDSSYAVYMATLYKKYPGNNEITSFYSLSLIGWGMVGYQVKVLEQAADISKEVLSRNPQHPGALHYIIHAYDNPEHAALALATADKYALVAPDAGHALHMPTHTYLALGLWDKVISSNIISWAAEKERKERKKLDNNAFGYHSYHWLEYGYLQQGNKEKARLMLDSMQQYCTELPSPAARAHMIFLKTTYLAETNDFSEKVVGINVKQDDLNILSRTMNYYVNGMAAYNKKDAAELDKIITQMTGERLIEREKVPAKGIRVCGNVNRSIPTLTDLQKSEVMELELKAMQAWLKKDAATTDRLLKQATEMENTSTYAYGPPRIIKPSFELYGEWLLETNKPKEALEQFELSLKWAPNKLLSIKGKEKATAILKETGVAMR